VRARAAFPCPIKSEAAPNKGGEQRRRIEEQLRDDLTLEAGPNRLQSNLPRLVGPIADPLFGDNSG
jgi:hypothetical protein